MLSSIWQGAATDGAHNYGPGTHLYSLVERGTSCVNTLPKDAILKYGQCRFRTHDPWIVSPRPYHCATEATAHHCTSSSTLYTTSSSTSTGRVHQHCPRQATKNDIFLTQKNTSQYGLRSVRYFGARCWNDIPMNIKKSPSTISFRRKLKAFLFENNYQN